MFLTVWDSAIPAAKHVEIPKRAGRRIKSRLRIFLASGLSARVQVKVSSGLQRPFQQLFRLQGNPGWHLFPYARRHGFRL